MLTGSEYVLTPESAELYKKVMITVFDEAAQTRKTDKRTILTQLEEQNKMLNKARTLLLTEEITPDDYRTIKHNCEQKIVQLEARLSDFDSTVTKLDVLVDKAVTVLSKLNVLYERATVSGKREIISSMYPENLTFDGKQHRTNRVNKAAMFICMISK